jgi:flagellar hook-length control protein FliK
MAALNPLPAAAVSSAKTAAAPAAPADGAADVSFQAVLGAQLGLSNAPQIVALLGDEAAADDKSSPQAASDAAAADPSTNAAAIAFALPAMAVQTSVVASDTPDAKAHGSDASLRSANASALLGTVEKSLPGLVAQDIPAPAGVSPAMPAAASFAAALQSLPADTADAARPERASAASDGPPLPPAEVVLPTAQMRPEAGHRAADASTNIPVPVQDARWADAFSERVVWVTNQRVQAAEIHIEPPQLGPIEVRVSITNDQANLLFTAPHAVARDAIQTSLPRLQEVLFDSGLTLGNVSVGAHSPGNGQTAYHDDRGAASSDAATVGIEAGAKQTVTSLQRGLGLVDLFA